MNSLNWIDGMLLFTVGVSFLAGLWRGAVRTIFSLAGLALGFWVASRESGAMALLLEKWLSPRSAAAIAFVFVFLGIGLAFGLAGWLLRRALDRLALSWVDRIAGGAFGLLRGFAIVGVFALAVESTGGLPAARRAATYPWALRCGATLLDLIPEGARERLHWDVLKRRIPEKLRAAEDDEDVV